LAERLDIHHTPKHGSWLNMAEIRAFDMSTSNHAAQTSTVKSSGHTASMNRNLINSLCIQRM